MYSNIMLDQFFIERNHSENTKKNYRISCKLFEEVIGKPLNELIDIAKSENELKWDETQFRLWLIQFRNYCYENYKEDTGKRYIQRIKTVFRHYGVDIGELPYASTKQVRKSEQIDYEDLPNRQVLKKCIELKNPLLKASTLFLSSSGISKTDALNLTIQDYLDATMEYHNSNNIYEAINLMDKSEISIIPTFKLQRQKTGETYRTFCSPEAVKAINIYLLSREYLENDDKLFDIGERQFSRIFQQTNDKLNLGRVNGNRRFTPQMLRSYQASQLAEGGMTDSNIDLIQGRKPQSIARKSYIRIKRSTLKEQYIKCLPFLVVEDIEEIRTELDVVKKEKETLKSENQLLVDKIMGFEDDINKLKSWYNKE